MPVESAVLRGVDSLLSIVQMPAGIPVGTLAIGKAGAINAALLAATILGNKDPKYRQAVHEYRAKQTVAVLTHPDPRDNRRPAAGDSSCTSASSAADNSVACWPWPGTRWRCDFRVLEPAAECPAAAVGYHLRGEYEDFQALYSFCQGLDAVTYEFENVPVASARWLAERVPVFPTPDALEVGQDRLAEKSFFQQLGVPVPPFAAVDSRADLDAAVARIGLPAVLKTTPIRLRRQGPGGPAQRGRRRSGVGHARRPAADPGRFRPRSTASCRSWPSAAAPAKSAFYPLVENVHRAVFCG